MSTNINRLIDVPLWDRARWVGVVYGTAPGKPPFMALAFENYAAGIEIFTGLRSAVGKIDRDELIRVAIIEGDVAGRRPGYSVHIGPRAEALLQHAPADTRLLFSFNRLHRMNPEPGSPHLGNFKRAYAEHGRYLLLAAGFDVGSQPPSINWEHAIGKTRVELRNVADVARDNDPDSAIFSPDPPERGTLQ